MPDPKTAVLKVICGDLGLMNGEWKIANHVLNWNRTEWPMPDFIHQDSLLNSRAYLVRYSDIDPSKEISRIPTQYDPSLQRDALWGYGAVENKLTKLLDEKISQPLT